MRAGRKLSENFHFDINDENIRSILPNLVDNGEIDTNGDASTLNGSQTPELDQVSPDWIHFPKQVNFI